MDEDDDDQDGGYRLIETMVKGMMRVRMMMQMREKMMKMARVPGLLCL